MISEEYIIILIKLAYIKSWCVYFTEWIKDNARPEYWVPDKDISKCKICEAEFSERIPIHHCRACGHGVCDTCSKDRKAVPARGWDHPVRICDKCKNISLEVNSWWQCISSEKGG